MPPLSRRQHFQSLFPAEPNFRWNQIERALFDPVLKGWHEVSTLPFSMRQTIAAVTWISCTLFKIFLSKNNDTYKAILKTADQMLFETVLMQNKRGQWTICVSSQIGCAMQCTFCATGTMGLKRNLSSDEIVDQYRFWQRFLVEQNLSSRISNIVFMGMGEPLANYENVKEAILLWLKYTDLGSTRITVSSVGVLPLLEKILTDKTWPHVRMAISLHSANQKRRQEIVPTTVPDFLKKLADWSNRYAKILGNRRHYITYEYTLISGVNDSEATAHELADYILKTSASKINVIPYNPVRGKPFMRSQQERIEAFKTTLRARGIDVTQRRTMGDDISAACGQLVVEEGKG